MTMRRNGPCIFGNVQRVSFVVFDMSRSVRGFTTLLFALALLSIPAARAESPASKNKEGNRLFEQDKYQEAEKA